MEKRNLGKTGIKVSELGLGCWALGGFSSINGIPMTYGDVQENTANEIFKTAFLSGINTFDTADSYSLGNSEKRLSNALKEHREEIHIFTKAGIYPSNLESIPMETDLSYYNLLSTLDRSLKRLNTKYVDVFLSHKPPNSEKELENIEKTFETIKKEGKATACGISIGLNYEKGIELIENKNVDCIELYFSLIDCEPIKKLFPLAKKMNVGLIVAEPLSQGFLTGKYDKNNKFPKNDIRNYSYSPSLFEQKIEKSKQFEFLIKENRTLSQSALSYVLSKEEISTCVPGCKSIEQLKQNINVKNNLDREELDKIYKIQQQWL